MSAITPIPPAAKEPCWISREECLVLHEMLLRRYGGESGLRDPAALDAVAAQPRERWASGKERLPELAACYAVGIAVNCPFASGNLGSAFLIAATFLGVNGLRFRGNELRVVESMVEVWRRQQSEAELAHLLRCNCELIGGDPACRKITW